MKIDIQYPTLPLHPNIKIYLFGSACISNKARDIDILFVYDDRLICAEDIYSYLDPYCIELQLLNDKPVHSIVLTIKEEKSTRFIEQTNAKSLEYSPL